MSKRQTAARVEAISFQQLKLFESVGRLNSIRRGSDECNLSQPAVTQALAKLETLVGVSLFERHTSGSYLTLAGEILHRRVIRLFDQITTALIELGVPGGMTGAISAGHRLTRSQVRNLCAVIEHGSFAGAAGSLQVTNASIQRATRDLENNLYKTIFYKSAAGVMVSADGILLGSKVKLALQEIDWAIEEIAVALDAGESRIVIGALPFGGNVLLASVLEEFLDDHPHVNIKIINEGAAEMVKRLRSGDVDLVVGLIQETASDDLVGHVLAETPYAIVARKGHPLSTKINISDLDIARFDWIVGTEGSSRRACFDSLFCELRKPQTPVATCALPVIRELLVKSDRLTLMTSYELAQEDDLVGISSNARLPVPAIGITMRASWLSTALHRDFVSLMKKRVDAALASSALLAA